jgi:hypothetical protein
LPSQDEVIPEKKCEGNLATLRNMIIDNIGAFWDRWVWARASISGNVDESSTGG